ncbi:hypothetical protein ING2D1G_1074 [Peptoniphilus sp. ING2-D1G]|nr:hypothetical protein ING2D1G_1074 [Peptoniphilus sp. ING2-D1G]
MQKYLSLSRIKIVELIFDSALIQAFYYCELTELKYKMKQKNYYFKFLRRIL